MKQFCVHFSLYVPVHRKRCLAPGASGCKPCISRLSSPLKKLKKSLKRRWTWRENMSKAWETTSSGKLSSCRLGTPEQGNSGKCRGPWLNCRALNWGKTCESHRKTMKEVCDWSWFLEPVSSIFIALKNKTLIRSQFRKLYNITEHDVRTKKERILKSFSC